MKMDLFTLEKQLTTKNKGKDSIYSILMIFILEIGLLILWMGMVLMCLFQGKFIKDSLRRALSKVMVGVSIQMGNPMKDFGIKIIRQAWGKLSSPIKLYLLVFLNPILLKLKDSSLVLSARMESLYGKIKEFFSNIIGKKILWSKIKINKIKQTVKVS